MHLLCIGINHTTTPLDIREKLTFDEDGLRSALAPVGQGDLPGILELVMISTCNRVELYALSNNPEPSDLEAYLGELQEIPARELASHLYRYRAEQVVQHLFRVTAGLDSLVIGEPQILGQVTRALDLALEAGSCGSVLSRLFRAAIHAGKRVRTETAISRNPASVSSLAASLAEKALKNLVSAKVVVVGAGEMAERAVEALRKRGAAHIVVVNRTVARAQALAQRWQAQAATFEHLAEKILQADVVISSTSAPHKIIPAAWMAKIMNSRAHRAMVLIDIAVPRDIDPEVSRIPGIRLFDIDHLDQQVQSLLAERLAEVPRAEAILAEEQAVFLDYFRTVDMLPLITELRKQAEAIRQHELDRTFQRLPELTAMERERIEAMTRALVKKLLETPTQRLRSEAGCPHAPAYATVARTLFNLPIEDPVCAFSNEACPRPLEEAANCCQPISKAMSKQ